MRTVREGLYPRAESESESESSVSEEEVVPSGGTSSRPKVAGKTQSFSGFGLPDATERVATALEAHTVLLSLIAERMSQQLAAWKEEREIDETCFRQISKELHAINL